jgi:TPR repeat protein
VRQNKNTAKELFGKACDSGNNKGCKQFRLLSDTGIK